MDHFSVGELRRFISKHGLAVRYERAERCSCGSLNDAEAPRFDCPVCKGTGLRFYDVINMRVLMTGHTEKDFIEKYGVMPDGTVGITIPDVIMVNGAPIRIVPGEWDRITAMTRVTKYSQVLTRGERKISGRSKEHALFTHVLDGTTRISDIHTEYRENIDYRVQDDENGLHRLVVWENGHGPTNGVRYTFTYLARPTWIIVTDHPQARHENDVRLPSHVLAKQVNFVGMYQ